jgi:hypothetical protein
MLHGYVWVYGLTGLLGLQGRHQSSLVASAVSASVMLAASRPLGLVRLQPDQCAFWACWLRTAALAAKSAQHMACGQVICGLGLMPNAASVVQG